LELVVDGSKFHEHRSFDAVVAEMGGDPVQELSAWPWPRSSLRRRRRRRRTPRQALDIDSNGKPAEIT